VGARVHALRSDGILRLKTCKPVSCRRLLLRRVLA
jgi:hypothetical protein